MKKVTFGKQTRDRRGKLGGRVNVSLRHQRWFAAYAFDTHGISSKETADRIAQIEAHHVKWASRMDGFSGVLGTEIVIGGDLFRVVDCTIPGTGDGRVVQLVFGVCEVIGDRLENVPGFPVWVTFASIEEVWSNARIIEEIRQRLQAQRDARAAHNAYITKVNALVTG